MAHENISPLKLPHKRVSAVIVLFLLRMQLTFTSKTNFAPLFKWTASDRSRFRYYTSSLRDETTLLGCWGLSIDGHDRSHLIPTRPLPSHLRATTPTSPWSHYLYVEMEIERMSTIAQKQYIYNIHDSPNAMCDLSSELSSSTISIDRQIDTPFI